MSLRPWRLMSLAAALAAVWMGRVSLAQPEPTLADPVVPMLTPPAVPLPQVGPDTPPGLPPGIEVAPLPGLPADALPGEEEGYVPLDQGPVHEAYAEHITLDAPAPYVVQREPPAAVEELPPELAPEGAIWIPGYWMWMEEHEDFVWVSGVWRVPPPGRDWVPGHWSQIEEGFQWTPGFWNPVEAEELVYLPEPPTSLDLGPSYPAPADDYFWVPGCWTWNTTTVHYAWRPGYWNQGYSNWVWIPSRYQYTPRGCIRLTGYWDRPWVRRGLLFAPVRFVRPVYYRPGFVYRPRFWVNVGLSVASVFRTPNRGYFYGNYASPRYLTAGYVPWYGLSTGRFYDPFQQHHSIVVRRTQPNWINDFRRDFDRISHEPHPGFHRPILGHGLSQEHNHANLSFLRDVSALRTGHNQDFDSIREISLSRLQRPDLQTAVNRSAQQFGELRHQRDLVESRFRGLGEGISREKPLLTPPGSGNPMARDLDRGPQPRGAVGPGNTVNGTTSLSSGRGGLGPNHGDLGRLKLPRASALDGLSQGAAGEAPVRNNVLRPGVNTENSAGPGRTPEISGANPVGNPRPAIGSSTPQVRNLNPGIERDSDRPSGRGNRPEMTDSQPLTPRTEGRSITPLPRSSNPVTGAEVNRPLFPGNRPDSARTLPTPTPQPTGPTPAPVIRNLNPSQGTETNRPLAPVQRLNPGTRSSERTIPTPGASAQPTPSPRSLPRLDVTPRSIPGQTVIPRSAPQSSPSFRSQAPVIQAPRTISPPVTRSLPQTAPAPRVSSPAPGGGGGFRPGSSAGPRSGGGGGPGSGGSNRRGK